MISEIRSIAELQQQYSSSNTPKMKARGVLIRRDLPNRLREHWNEFSSSLAHHSHDMEVEGSDGIGRKTQAPWVRIYSKSLSPSATIGFYMVIHFSTNGECCFVTVGCGASKWDNEKGDLVKYSNEEIEKKVNWAKNTFLEAGFKLDDFSDQIDIGSSHDLPKSFEKATVLCQRHKIETVTENEMVESICQALEYLKVIYDNYSQLKDLTQSEISQIEVDAIVNPSKKNAGSRQGYGLSAPERRAVELRAMKVTKEHLSSLGYELEDTSARKPFDFLAKKEGEEVKVEVKGTTSNEVDAIMMTSNEVDLHIAEQGSTALAIVSKITFLKRGSKAECNGGVLEFIYPWAIDEWHLTPKAFLVGRSDNNNMQ